MPVQAMPSSPTAKILAAAENGGQIHLWNPVTGRELRRLGKSSRRIYSIAFSPDGTRIISAERTLRLWQVANGKELPFAQPPSAAFAVAFAPDGKTVASGHE